MIGEPQRPNGEVDRTDESAPAFELPGTNGSGWKLYRLRDHIADGVAVVCFVPSGSIERVEPFTWLQFTAGIDVLAVSDVRCATFERNEELKRIQCPLLGDPDEVVAPAYGTTYDGGDGSVVLVDRQGQIRGQWHADADPTQIYRASQALLESEFDDRTEGVQG